MTGLVLALRDPEVRPPTGGNSDIVNHRASGATFRAALSVRAGGPWPLSSAAPAGRDRVSAEDAAVTVYVAGDAQHVS